MIYDFLIASVAGAIGTALMTGMMLFGKQVNLAVVDAHGILGYMQNSERATPLGYVMHWVNGVIFAIAYGIAFRLIAGNAIVLATVLGIIHWLAVGWLFAFAPLLHAGMKAGTVEATGAYMLKSLGIVGFIAGMIGHIVFGLAVVQVYTWLGGSFAVS